MCALYHLTKNKGKSKSKMELKEGVEWEGTSAAATKRANDVSRVPTAHEWTRPPPCCRTIRCLPISNVCVCARARTSPLTRFNFVKPHRISAGNLGCMVNQERCLARNAYPYNVDFSSLCRTFPEVLKRWSPTHSVRLSTVTLDSRKIAEKGSVIHSRTSLAQYKALLVD